MTSTFKENMQKALIEKISTEDKIVSMDPMSSYSKGFMDCFELIQQDITGILTGLDEIANGDLFYAELPTVAKETLSKWNWNKIRHFKKDGF